MSEANDDDAYPRGVNLKLTAGEWVFLVGICAVSLSICGAFLAVCYVIARFLWALAFSPS